MKQKNKGNNYIKYIKFHNVYETKLILKLQFDFLIAIVFHKMAVWYYLAEDSNDQKK